MPNVIQPRPTFPGHYLISTAKYFKRCKWSTWKSTEQTLSVFRRRYTGIRKILVLLAVIITRHVAKWLFRRTSISISNNNNNACHTHAAHYQWTFSLVNSGRTIRVRAYPQIVTTTMVSATMDCRWVAKNRVSEWSHLGQQIPYHVIVIIHPRHTIIHRIR